MSATHDSNGLATKLEAISARYEEVRASLEDPEVFSDPKRYRDLAKEKGRLEEIVVKYRRYQKAGSDLEGNREFVKSESDPDLLAMAEEDISTLRRERERLEGELKRALVPTDPNDAKDAIVEIRAGTGGDEAALFAGDLFRMYGRFAEGQKWKVEILVSNPTDLGGFKEIIFAVEGEGVYSKLKYEGGVHRVQRIPATEAGGRIHTSTATVAVLPEVGDDVTIEINPDDLRVDTFMSSGKGGQGVNTTYSAVRVTHLPTNTVVTCQDERSQIQNRERAMRILRSRLEAAAEEERSRESTKDRRSQIGTGERAEKIRTYNFPQNRVTDHRIGFTSHRLTEMLNGAIEEIVEALVAEDERLKLEQAE